jgi:hypothetical protein
MRYHEERFDEYISAVENADLHPSIGKMFKGGPCTDKTLSNLIIYGPSGVGKYSQALRLLKPYSPTDLKYCNTITLQSGKQEHHLKISDIHYEVDMEQLGCNSRTLWCDIHTHIVDVVRSKHTETKFGVILCKNFHKIANDLLETFYSYIQNTDKGITVKYIFLTESVSFIPDSIVSSCRIVPVARPSKSTYGKCLGINTRQIDTSRIHNIKDLKDKVNYMNPSHSYSDKIVSSILDYENIKMYEMREILYNLLIFDVGPIETLWGTISLLLTAGHIEKNQLQYILISCFEFLQHYNNNYRPIYHLESLVYSIIKIIHEL